jgi:hypothetical protein
VYGNLPPVKNMSMSETWGNLLLHWCDSMTRKFAVGALAETTLFAQRFPANTVLTGLADSTLQYRRWFSTHHAFFERISHGIIILFFKDCR